MKKILLSLLIAAMFLFSACQKEETDPVNPAKSIEELTVSKDFKWSTAQSVTVHVIGLPTPVPIRNVLIISTPDGIELLKTNHLMSEDLIFKVELRSTYKELRLKFGAKQLTSQIKDGNAEFSFIPSDN